MKEADEVNIYFEVAKSFAVVRLAGLLLQFWQAIGFRETKYSVRDHLKDFSFD